MAIPSRRFAAILAAALFSTSPVLLADTIRVPMDSETIQGAVDMAAPLDEVLISSGNYVENIVVPPGLDGLTIRGKGKVVIDAHIGLQSSDGIRVLSANVTISKLTIRHAGSVGISAYQLTEGVGSVDGLTIDKVNIINSASAGIDVAGNDAMVTGCVLVGNGNGILINGDDCTVTKTSVLNDCDRGVRINGINAEVSRCTIDVIEDGNGINVWGDNCLIDRNNVSNTCAELIFVRSDGGVVSRNKVWAGDSDGIDAGGTDITISKNTISDTGDDDDGIELYSTSGAVVEGNKVYRATEEGYNLNVFNALISKNLADRCGSEDECGFRVDGSNNMIESNTARECDSSGFEVSGSSNTLMKNKSFNNTDNGFLLTSSGEGGVPSAVDNTLEKNLARGNHGEGLENQAGNTTVTKNTFQKNRLDLTNATADGATLVDGGGNKFDTGDFTFEPEIN